MFVTEHAGPGGRGLVHPVMTDAEPGEHATSRHRRVKAIPIVKVTDDNEAGAHLLDRRRQFGFRGGNRDAAKIGAGRKHGLGTTIFRFGDEDERRRHDVSLLAPAARMNPCNDAAPDSARSVRRRPGPDAAPTAPTKVLSLRQGVCQDFAHVQI